MKQIAQMTNKEKDIILENLTAFKLHVTSKVPGTGIVTAGGVDTDEIDSATMESKLVPNLFFAGEMINVDGLRMVRRFRLNGNSCLALYGNLEITCKICKQKIG